MSNLISSPPKALGPCQNLVSLLLFPPSLEYFSVFTSLLFSFDMLKKNHNKVIPLEIYASQHRVFKYFTLKNSHYYYFYLQINVFLFPSTTYCTCVVIRSQYNKKNHNSHIFLPIYFSMSFHFFLLFCAINVNFTKHVVVCILICTILFLSGLTILVIHP